MLRIGEVDLGNVISRHAVAEAVVTIFLHNNHLGSMGSKEVKVAVLGLLYSTLDKVIISGSDNNDMDIFRELFLNILEEINEYHLILIDEYFSHMKELARVRLELYSGTRGITPLLLQEVLGTRGTYDALIIEHQEVFKRAYTI